MYILCTLYTFCTVSELVSSRKAPSTLIRGNREVGRFVSKRSRRPFSTNKQYYYLIKSAV